MTREDAEKNSDEMWSNYGAEFRHGLELLTPEKVEEMEGWLDDVSAEVPSSQPPTFVFNAEKLTEKRATFSVLLWYLSWFELVYFDKKGLSEVKFVLRILGQNWKFILRSSRDTLYATCVKYDEVFPENEWESHSESHRRNNGNSEDFKCHVIFPPASRFWDQHPRRPRSNQSRHYSFVYEWQWEDNTELPSYAPILACFSQYTQMKQKNIAGCILELLKSHDLWYGPMKSPENSLKVMKLEGEEIPVELTRSILNFIFITHTCECAPISLQHAQLLRRNPEPHCDLVQLFELLRKLRPSESDDVEKTDTRMSGRVMGSESILQKCLEAFQVGNQTVSLGEFLEKNYPLLKKNVGLREGRESMSWGGVHFDRLVKVLHSNLRRQIETNDPLSLVREKLMSFHKFHLSEVKVFPGPVSMDIDDVFVHPDFEFSKPGKDGEKEDSYFRGNGTVEHLAELTRRCKLVLLRGDPASGKTVYMKKIAIDWARHVGSKLQAEFDLVFFLELSKVSDLKSSSCLALAMHYLAKQFDRGLGDSGLREALISKLCEEKLISGGFFNGKQIVQGASRPPRLLFLFDGLDEGTLELAETPESLHAKFTADLPKKFSENCCFLISSRSYSRFLKNQKKFPMVTLLGFTILDQRLSFFKKKIEQTEESVFPEKKPQKSSKNRLELLCNFLAKSVLPEQDDKSPLFSFPLLLSFIYTISEDRIVRRNQSSEEELAALKEELTSSKTELYYNVLEIFKVRHFEKFNNTFQVLPKFEMDDESKKPKTKLKKTNKSENAQTGDKPWFKESYMEAIKRLALMKLLEKEGADALQLSGKELFEIDRKCLEIGYLVEEETLKTRSVLFHHKTVQEFFAALYFVERSADAIAFTQLTLFEKFYNEYELNNLSEVIIFILGLYGVTGKCSIFTKNEGLDFIINRISAFEKSELCERSVRPELMKSLQKATLYDLNYKHSLGKCQELHSMCREIIDRFNREFHQNKELSFEDILQCIPRQIMSVQFIYPASQFLIICFQYLDEIVILGFSKVDSRDKAIILKDEFNRMMKIYGECQAKSEKLRLYNFNFRFSLDEVLDDIPELKCLSLKRCGFESAEDNYIIPNHVESIEFDSKVRMWGELEESIVKNCPSNNLVALLERTTFLNLEVKKEDTQLSPQDIILWLLSTMPKNSLFLLDYIQ